MMIMTLIFWGEKIRPSEAWEATDIILSYLVQGDVDP